MVLFSGLIAFTMALHTPITRRGIVATGLAATGFVARPHRAAAGLFGPDGPQGEFRQLQLAQTRLNELASKLKSKELRGDTDDAIVVLQTLTIQIAGTSKLIGKASADMPLLDTAKLNGFATAFDKEIEGIKQSCRDQQADGQLAGTEAASRVLSEYFELAATKYTLPTVADNSFAAPGSSEFIAQYYGLFSCEGQGLERIPGSNSCKDRLQKSDNKNPLPSKKLLKFDFLTGEKLDR